MNERVFNSRKYAQLLLGKDRILSNQKHFIERSVPIIVLCTENTCPFIYNCNTENDDFLRRFFENALVLDLCSLDMRNNKDINNCAILENNITQRIKVIQGPVSDESERWVNLNSSHFDYEYFDIVHGNDAMETNPLEESVYGIPSSSRMIIDNDTEDIITVHSDDTM